MEKSETAATMPVGWKKHSLGNETVRTCLAVLAFLLAGAAPAAGQDLLLNRTFDSDLDGWFVFGTAGGGQSLWDPFDAGGSPDSGSVLVVNMQPDANRCSGLFRSDLLPVEEGVEYWFGGSAWIPSGQVDGYVRFELQFLQVGCGGVAPPIAFTPDIVEVEQWRSVSLRRIAPPWTACALFALEVCKWPAGGVFEAFVDNVFFFGPEIFKDGFESGDVSAWSGGMP